MISLVLKFCYRCYKMAYLSILADKNYLNRKLYLGVAYSCERDPDHLKSRSLSIVSHHAVVNTIKLRLIFRISSPNLVFNRLNFITHTHATSSSVAKTLRSDLPGNLIITSNKTFGVYDYSSSAFSIIIDFKLTCPRCRAFSHDSSYSSFNCSN